jgi:hypothetical protein
VAAYSSSGSSSLAFEDDSNAGDERTVSVAPPTSVPNGPDARVCFMNDEHSVVKKLRKKWNMWIATNGFEHLSAFTASIPILLISSDVSSTVRADFLAKMVAVDVPVLPVVIGQGSSGIDSGSGNADPIARVRTSDALTKTYSTTKGFKADGGIIHGIILYESCDISYSTYVKGIQLHAKLEDELRKEWKKQYASKDVFLAQWTMSTGRASAHEAKSSYLTTSREPDRLRRPRPLELACGIDLAAIRPCVSGSEPLGRAAAVLHSSSAVADRVQG